MTTDSDGTDATLSPTAVLNDSTTNVVVLSEAGKPIFARRPVNENFGLLVQALRTSMNNDNHAPLGLGEMQCLESNQRIIVFMTVGSITLMSISKRSNGDGQQRGGGNAFVFAKYQLEYVYGQLIMTLTDQVQSIFQHNPAFDLRSMMNSNDNLLNGILDDMNAVHGSSSSAKTSSYLVAAVRPLFPIPFKIRHRVSKVLQSVAGKLENNAAFALLVAEDKIISLVQPAYLPHQLKTSDLHLILHFVTKQPGLTSSELWMPLCLPRFNSSGFLYAYTKCFDVASKLTLILLSSHGTTEQFQVLRETSQRIQEDLRLPLDADSIITITSTSVKDDSGASASSTTSSDVEWRRGDESTMFDDILEDDYVNISNDMLLGKDTPTEDEDLLYHVRQAREESALELLCSSFLTEEISSLVHFVLRVDVSIKNCSKQRTTSPHHGQGHLSQCISLPLSNFFGDNYQLQRLWDNYQKLSLRLRLGSSTVESSMDAFDMINDSYAGDTDDQPNGNIFPTISKDCPGTGLVESPACTLDGVTYIIEGEKMYLGMNGKDFELYLVASSDIPIKRAAAIGTKVVRGIMSDERNIFLSKPLTWRY